MSIPNKMDLKRLCTLRARLLTLILCCCVVWSVYSVLAAPFTRQMLTRVTAGISPVFENAFIQGIDSFYLTRVPYGNVFLRFDGLEPVADGTFVYVQFMRATYFLFPRRVFVSESEIMLRGSEDILAVNHMPTVTWLQHHDVAFVITFRYQNNKPEVDVREVGRESQPP